MQLDQVNDQHTDVDVLICSYKDIDDIAEKLQHQALKFIGTIEDTLAEKIRFLLKNGFHEVVVTSDHGFVLTGILTESDKVEVQFKGEFDKAERYIRSVEKQNVTTDYIEIKQSYGNYQYLYFTKNMKPFKTPGKYGYAHGGLGTSGADYSLYHLQFTDRNGSGTANIRDQSKPVKRRSWGQFFYSS